MEQIELIAALVNGINENIRDGWTLRESMEDVLEQAETELVENGYVLDCHEWVKE